MIPFNPRKLPPFSELLSLLDGHPVLQTKAQRNFDLQFLDLGGGIVQPGKSDDPSSSDEPVNTTSHAENRPAQELGEPRTSSIPRNVTIRTLPYRGTPKVDSSNGSGML